MYGGNILGHESCVQSGDFNIVGEVLGMCRRILEIGHGAIQTAKSQA